MKLVQNILLILTLTNLNLQLINSKQTTNHKIEKKEQNEKDKEISKTSGEVGTKDNNKNNTEDISVDIINYVEELSEENFFSFISKSPQKLLLVIYAPWCNYSKIVNENVTNAAFILKNKSSNVKFARIDGIAFNIITKQMKLKEYPAIIYFFNGVSYHFTGERNPRGIVDWIESNPDPKDLTQYYYETMADSISHTITIKNTNVPREEKVYILSDNNVKSFIKQNEYTFILMYDSNLINHKEIIEKWNYLSNYLTKHIDFEEIIFARLDVGIHRKYYNSKTFDNIPIFTLFYLEQHNIYSGDFNEIEMYLYLKSKVINVKRPLNTMMELEIFKNDVQKAGKLPLLFFGLRYFNNFKLAALLNDEAGFAFTNSNEIANNFDIADGNVVVFRDFDLPNYIIRRVPNTNAFSTIIDNLYVPPFMVYSHKLDIRMRERKKVPLLIIYNSSEHQTSEVDKLAKNIPSKFLDLVNLYKLDYNNDDERHLLNNFNVEERYLPLFLILDYSTPEHKKYYYNRNVKEKAINKIITSTNNSKKSKMEFKESDKLIFLAENDLSRFIKAFKSKTARRFFKSEVIPLEPLVPNKLVGENFDDVVFDESKDVLVLFNCEHCKLFRDLQDTFVKLSRELIHNEHLIIAEIDVVLNEFDMHLINNSKQLGVLPILALFKSGEKSKPIIFDQYDVGGRISLFEVLTNFLKANCKFEVLTKAELLLKLEKSKSEPEPSDRTIDDL